MQSKNVFELYKPLRNHLRQISLPESLRVVWAYSQNLQFNTKIPNDIEAAPEFRFAKDTISKQVYAWELELLAREIIINSEQVTTSKKTITEWKYFATALNKLRKLENDVYRECVGDKYIRPEIHRIAHRQFPWQSRPNEIFMTRYFKIFSYKPLGEIVQNVIGLTTKEIYLIGMAVFSVYLKEFVLFYPPSRIDIKGITQENLKIFLDHFSCELKSLQRVLLNKQEMNDKFAYSYNSLRTYPIIKMVYNKKGAYVCPSPTLLIWRLTSGIYYDVCKERGFDNAFGYSFQNYIGEVLKVSNIHNKITICGEGQYTIRREKKDTIDWIADEGGAALFIECKTKRVTLPAKVELIAEEALDKDLNKMAEFIVQVYKTINDYRNNRYTSFKFNDGKAIYPLIVTLEEWFLFGGVTLESIKEKVHEQFRELELPVSWLSEMPYSICSTQEFEQIMQIVQNISIDNFMNKKVFDGENTSMNFVTYMSTYFPEESKKAKILFEEDFNMIFSSGLKDK